MTGTLRAPIVAFTLALAMLLALAAPGTASAKSHKTADGLVQQITAPVLDQLTDEEVGEFVGQIEITEIRREGEDLIFTATVTGELFDLAGDLIDTVDEVIEFTGTLTQTGDDTCQILSLDLGPLNLDLLGLVVDLSDVQLDITAERGSGNLLGNLLCSVAELLDSPDFDSLLATIDRLLNRISGLLG